MTMPTKTRISKRQELKLQDLRMSRETLTNLTDDEAGTALGGSTDCNNTPYCPTRNTSRGPLCR